MEKIYKNIWITLLFSLLFVSCTSFFDNTQKTDISFSLKENDTNYIKHNLSRSGNVSNDTKITLEALLYKGGRVALNDIKTVSYENLETVSFHFNDLPFGEDYAISINIYLNNICVFTGSIDNIKILSSDPFPILNLQLKEVNAVISYNLGGGDEPLYLPKNYNINSNITLPIPKKDGFIFKGWYTNDNKEVTQLGREYFVGDITLTARWIENIYKDVSITVTPSSSELDYEELITINEIPNVELFYTLDGNEPTLSSTKYTSPIKITDSCTLKVSAFRDGVKVGYKEERYTLKKYEVTFNLNGKGSYLAPISLHKGSLIEEPTKPTETDYLFSGWYLDNNTFKNPWDFSKNKVTGNVTLYAKWLDDRVPTISVSPNGGDIDFGDEITITSEGCDIYYTMDGSDPGDKNNRYTSAIKYDSSENATLRIYSERESGRNTTMNVSFTLKKYTVTYNLNGKGLNSGITNSTDLKKGDKVPKQSNPTEPNWRFDGWYLDNDNFTSPWDFDRNTITSNITLYAKWVDDSLPIINITPNGGDIDYGDEIAISSDGSEVYYTTDGTNPSLKQNRYIDPIPYNYENNITLKVYSVKDNGKESTKDLKFNLKKYNVTYDLNGKGLSSGITNSTGLKKGDKVPKQSNPTESNWKFDGWYLDNNNFTSLWDFDKNTITNSITLYAKWTDVKVPTLSITPDVTELDRNSLITISCDEALPIYYTTDGSDPLVSPTRTEYTSEISFTDTVTIKAAVEKPNVSPVTTEKTYNLKLYDIKFSVNGKGDYVPDVQQKAKGDLVTKPQDLVQRGYIFGGWYKSQGYQEQWDFDRDTVNGGKILHAKWDPITYTINFDANGSVSSSGEVLSPLTASYDGGVNLPSLSTFEKEGFSQTYLWNTQKDGQGTDYDPSNTDQVLNLTENNGETVTLYAKFTDVPPTPVTSLSAVQGDTEVTLNWTNPNLADFSNVEISYSATGSDPFTPVSSIPVSQKGETCSFNVTGLKNGTKYTFKVVAVDKGGNKSDAKTCTSYAMVALTESPRVVSGYTSRNTQDSSGTYVAFGDYPQSVKKSNVTLSSETVDINGFTCKYGSDGYYYTTIEASAFASSKYDDGTSIPTSGQQTFKIEPLMWKVITPNYIDKDGTDQGKLLMCEYIIDKNTFYPGTDPRNDSSSGKQISCDNYYHSEIRAKLNGIEYIGAYQSSISSEFLDKGILQQAFTPKAQALISNVKVDNSAASTVNNEKSSSSTNFCEDSVDKLFLISRNEATQSSYGFNKSTRGIRATEYIRAKRISEDEQTHKATWMTRSPDDTSGKNIVTYSEKGEQFGGQGNSNAYGIVPCLAIKF